MKTIDRIASLVPCPVLPERFSPRAQLVLWLKRIDHIHVRETIKDARGKRSYIVDVYKRLSQSHIPTQRPHHNNSKKPDITIHRAFSAFAKLLSDFYDLSHAGHGFLPCQFCGAFVDYMLAGKPAPSVVHRWLHSEAAVCELLTLYLNNLIQLTCRVKTYDDDCKCIGKQQIPALMKEFLSLNES